MAAKRVVSALIGRFHDARISLCQRQGFLHRSFATIDDIKAEVNTINDKFAEARDEIELAREDKETVYFQESYDTAKKVTDECLGLWSAALKKLDDSEREKLLRSMGLKMEQLKAEFAELDHLHDDH